MNDESPVRLLVTGGSGFIGTNLIDYYLERGMTILSIDIAAPKKDSHKPLWKNVDIVDYPALEASVLQFNPTHVYHLAARTDLDEKKNIEGYKANTIGVENLVKVLNKCASVKRVIVTSSMFVCEPGHDPKNYDDYAPHTVYGQSKVITEKVVKESKDIRFDWTIIRPTSIWGPWFGEPYNVFFHHVNNRTYFDIKGKTATKTYGFILNALHQMDKIMFTAPGELHGRTYYIGDSPGLHINEWAKEIASQLNIRLLPMPLFVIRLGSLFGDLVGLFGVRFPLQSFRMKNMTTDNTISLLQDTIWLVPDQPYSVKEGVAITLKWLKDHDAAFAK